MKIKIKYINKKIIAGLLAGTIALSLTGCTYYDGKYETNENGEVELIDTYSYDEVKEFYLLELKTSVGTTSYFVRKFKQGYVYYNDNNVAYYTYDIYTNAYLGNVDYANNIFVEPENFEIINLETLDSYLIGLNFIKANYNIEDLKWLHNQIEESLKSKNGNQKIKE